MRFHQIRIQGKHLLQLDNRQILTALLAVQQRLIVFLDSLVNSL